MGPNWRKLIFGGAMIAGSCAVSKAAGVDPAMTSMIATALLGAVGGNLAHEVFNASDKTLFDELGRREPVIDENHHIILQLRRSYLNALRKLVTDMAEEPAQSEADAAFIEGMNNYLHEAATPDRLLPHSDVTNAEREAFGAMPDVLRMGLAARGERPDPETVRNAEKANAKLIDAALREFAVEIKLQPTPLFFSLACRKRDGFIDLFVRDAARALKENCDFQTIWSAEALARIEGGIEQLLVTVEQGFRGIHAKLDTVL